MDSRRHHGFGTRATRTCVAAALLAAALSACVEDEKIPDLPLTWNSPGKDIGSITLRADGTGTFIKVPHGAGDDCAAGGEFALTGNVTWRVVDRNRHLYVADIDGSRVFFGPHSVPFDFSWDKTLVYTCEEKTEYGDPITRYTTFIPPHSESD